jgi:type II secretory pathway component PulF
MPKFNFSVRDQEGKLIKGNMEAPDSESVVEKLMAKNYLVVSIEKDSENVWAIDLGAKFARIKSKDLVFLYLQFSNLINRDHTDLRTDSNILIPFSTLD